MDVTALICVRDGEAYLAEALESVRAQTLPVTEVVVVDDGSTDGSAEIARAHGARVVHQEALGLGAARNHALRECRTEMAAFIDADDLWVPDKLQLQAEAFEADPELDICFGHAVEFADPGTQGLAVRPAPVPAPFSTTLCARIDAFSRAGGFDETRGVGETLSWLLRAREAGLRERTLPQVLAHRRVHARNMTRTLRHEYGDYARMLKAAIDRRRESA